MTIYKEKEQPMEAKSFTHVIAGDKTIYGLGLLGKDGELLDEFITPEPILTPNNKGYHITITIKEVNNENG